MSKDTGRDFTVHDGELRVRDLPEESLLMRILPRLPLGTQTVVGPGDDAAQVRASSGSVLTSADVLVEGRHFRREWSSGADVGWRAAMQNLADIAAMGGRPTALVVSLVCPPDLEVAWVEDFAHGMADACSHADVGVVGGDLSSGDAIIVAVTVLGELPDGVPVVLRSGARVGDIVAHCGVQGRSAAGLEICKATQRHLDAGGDGDLGIPMDRATGLVLSYLRPQPPLDLGPLASRCGATSMMDVSDGLLRDAARIAKASAVSLQFDDPRLTFAEEYGYLSEAAEVLGLDALDWILTGGEDHGLLATFPPDADLPEMFRPVGRVLMPELRNPTVDVLSVSVPRRQGWDHFAQS